MHSQALRHVPTLHRGRAWDSVRPPNVLDLATPDPLSLPVPAGCTLPPLGHMHRPGHWAGGALPHTRHCQAMLPSTCLSLGLTREQQAQGHSLNLWGSGWGPPEKWYLLQPESLCGQGPFGRMTKSPACHVGLAAVPASAPGTPRTPPFPGNLAQQLLVRKSQDRGLVLISHVFV